MFCVRPSFPFGFEGGVKDLIVLIPDHCISFDFKTAIPLTQRILIRGLTVNSCYLIILIR